MIDEVYRVGKPFDEKSIQDDSKLTKKEGFH